MKINTSKIFCNVVAIDKVAMGIIQVDARPITHRESITVSFYIVSINNIKFGIPHSNDMTNIALYCIVRYIIILGMPNTNTP